VDLITVAQAAHWFDLDAFYREAERVLKPSGVLALWCYGLAHVTPEIDSLVETFFSKTVGPYWPDKRRHIDNDYATLAFPYKQLATPRFEMELTWTADQCLDYLKTWSAVKRYEADRGINPVDALCGPLSAAWGEQPRTVTWPLTLKAARPGDELRLPDQA
jgi:SAM-dependent methyltransferase